MAKAKTVLKNGSSLSPPRIKTVPAAEEDDDEEVVFQDDENVISASEDEDGNGSDVERRHTKLLEAISSLGGKRRKKLAERSEASLQVSEFSVNAEGAGDKVNLSDLLGSMDQVPGGLSKTKKQLKALQGRKDTLELPLSRQETERIQRSVAYEKSSKDVSRWQTVVQQNQRAEQLVFPLDQEPIRPKRVEQVVMGWKAQTPLEQEIFSLLHINKQPVHDPVLTPVEQASLKAMSLEEARLRRAELQKVRALQSYYEAKARRQRQIKSKKYHKLQKKAKSKDFQKQFDEMIKTDPAGALEELKKMEKSRVQERMSLKHQNSGKWAKSKAIMAKYDDSARKAMQEQLQMNKDLTQKLLVLSDSEDEKDEDEEANVLPDFVNDPEPILDPANPWMRGKLTSEVPEPQSATADTSEPDPGARQDGQEEDKDGEEEENEEDALLREFERKRKLRRSEEVDPTPMPPVEPEEAPGEGGASAISDDSELEEEQEEEVTEFNALFTRLMEGSHQRGTAPPPPPSSAPDAGPVDGGPLLDEGLERVQTVEDLEELEEVLEPESSGPASAPATETQAPLDPSEPPGKKRKEINPTAVLTREARGIKVPLAPTIVEEEEEDQYEQTKIIKEAFAGDDVISDFLKDKRKQEEAGKPKVVDLSLPGWGEWGGGGLKVSRRKRKKFRVNVEPPPPRKDGKLPDVIISEKRDSSIALHQVSQLPSVFQTPAQFESTVRCPVGQTWNTQSTVQKMTAPRVVTMMGTIIDPMSREELSKGDEKVAAMASGTAARNRPAIKLSQSQRASRKKRDPKRKKSKK